MAKIRIFGLDLRRVGRLLSVGEEAAASQPLPQPNGIDVRASERGSLAEPTMPVAGLLEQPGSWIGPYKLLQVLGEGGMGIVYLAEQEHPIRRQVALKIIKPGMDSKRVLARFEAEQQALAMMEHPHIARVYDAGLGLSGRPYFVMEHIQGVPITEHCDKFRLTIEQRLYLFLHVCAAVQHAHQKGIIHRDLKPANVLVAIQDQEAIPKIIDFGIARAISEPLTERTFFTEQGQLIGTPEYMSPEQADVGNQDIDTRTDIYALGVILYVLLSGVLPFDPQMFREGGIEHIRKIICEEELKTPSTRLSKTSHEESTKSAQCRRTDVQTLQRKLHGDLDWIILKAMEKDRTRRYATVDALAADVRNHLQHQPVMAAPPGTLYRVRKFARRHKYTSTIAGLLVVIVLGFLGFSLQLSIRLEQANSELRRQKEWSTNQTAGLARAAQTVLLSRFLDAWHRGDQRSTSLLAGAFASGTREALAVRFLQDERLLDDKISEFRQQLQANEPYFQEFIVAEHYLRDGQWRRAEAAYRTCLSNPGVEQKDRELAIWIGNRLHELTDGADRNETPAAEEGPRP